MIANPLASLNEAARQMLQTVAVEY